MNVDAYFSILCTVSVHFRYIASEIQFISC
jgi:hypothetical protein